MSKNKLVLGTAQFGMDYGINNERGKIPREEVFEILSEALSSGIDTFDTAYDYGESELLIGEFVKTFQKNLRIISKLPKCEPSEVDSLFNTSIDRLGVDSLYGYYIHNFQNYIENQGIWEVLEDMKAGEKIRKIGFSLYYPSELEYILNNNVNVDMIQLPYSVFDRRFEKYFSTLKNKNVEIYVRSIFLQGLGFRDPLKLKGSFEKIKDKILGLRLISKKMNIPLASLFLNFVMLNNYVDRVVIGVDSLENLREIVTYSSQENEVEPVMEELAFYRENDEQIILPVNWK